ncbi:hypothetical protein PMIN04_005694 [Paraphaeosphaeria minitans]
MPPPPTLLHSFDLQHPPEIAGSLIRLHSLTSQPLTPSSQIRLHNPRVQQHNRDSLPLQIHGQALKHRIHRRIAPSIRILPSTPVVGNTTHPAAHNGDFGFFREEEVRQECLR